MPHSASLLPAAADLQTPDHLSRGHLFPAPPERPGPPLPPILRVTTLNLNGVRSALRRGLGEWVAREEPDVLLLQEVRAPPHPQAFPDYHSAWFGAQKPGYSGVALLSRWPLEDLRLGLDAGRGTNLGGADPGPDAAQFGAEGRLVSARTAGIRFVSVYLPSGSSGPERQGFKERVLGEYQSWVAGLLRGGEPLVIGGDYNLAHQPADLKNWRANTRNSGFLPQEREWMTSHLALGLRDSHRAHLGERSEYTWWSQRGGAYDRDVGWRIDYLLTSGLEVGEVWADRGARLSDHAPLNARLRMPGLGA